MSGFVRRSSISSRRNLSVHLEEPLDPDSYQSQTTEGSIVTEKTGEPLNEVKRDDNSNPYWLEDFFPEDRELGSGEVTFMGGPEVDFWNDMIDKYLKPLEMTDEEKKKQKTDLMGYRDQLI